MIHKKMSHDNNPAQLQTDISEASLPEGKKEAVAEKQHGYDSGLDEVREKSLDHRESDHAHSVGSIRAKKILVQNYLPTFHLVSTSTGLAVPALV